MSNDTIYFQVFSMTDHDEAFEGSAQGPYQGINSELHTSEIEGATLKISTENKAPAGDLDRKSVGEAKLILAYRHTDTGILQGTSEQIISPSSLPWRELPGFEVLNQGEGGSLRLKLWNEELELESDRLLRIQFGKTLVFLRNFGAIDGISWTSDSLMHGPLDLHSDIVDQELTIAPPTGPGIVAKSGQETSD